MDLSHFRTSDIVQPALEVCRILRHHQYDAYIVGGAVRDALMRRAIGDVDLATNATPTEVSQLFSKVIPTGIGFGTVTVCVEYAGETVQFQVTTYRSDGTYSNQRHPDSVHFETELDKDLSRRDFTINAMAYDPLADQLVDLYGGEADIDAKLLRVVGHASQRFSEDALRLFRLCRFASQLGFQPDQLALDAFYEGAKTCELPAVERVLVELNKLMASDGPEIGLELLRSSGILTRYCSAFDGLSHEKFAQLSKAPVSCRWAMLLSDLDYKLISNVLRFSKKDQAWIHQLITCGLDPKKAAFTVKDLVLSGQAIQAMGYEGAQIGEIQRFLHYKVLEDFSLNTTEALTRLIQEEFAT